MEGFTQLHPELTASGAEAVQIVPDDLSNPWGVLTLHLYINFLLRKQLTKSAFYLYWQGWRDSNPQPSVLETAVLPIGTTPLKLLTSVGLKMLSNNANFSYINLVESSIFREKF